MAWSPGCGTSSPTRRDGANIRKTGLPALLAAEIRGLEWLRVAGGPSLPQVVELTGDQLVLEWIEPGRP